MTARERLGDRAERYGYVSRSDIELLLQEQRRRVAEGERHHRLGYLLIQAGLISPGQLIQLLQDDLGGFQLREEAIRLASRLTSVLGAEARSVAFTGLEEGSGVTTITCQVALAMALMDHGPVLVLDADHHNPGVHALFDLARGPGLAEVLAGTASPDDAVQDTGVQGLSVLSLGHAGEDFVANLVSDKMAKLLALLRDRYRLVLLDVPPLSEHSESAVLAQRARSVVGVAVAGVATKAELAELASVVRGVQANFLGVVLAETGPPADAPFQRVVKRARDRVTVVHLIHTIAYGGIETILINWVRNLHRAGVDAHLVCFANPGETEAPFVNGARQAGISVSKIPWSRSKPVLKASRELQRILRAVDADVVHTHNVYADIVGLLAARRTGAAAISTVYVWADFDLRRNLLQRIDAMILRWFDQVTAQCERTRLDTVARGIPAERTAVLPSGFPALPRRLDEDDRRARRAELGVAEDDVVLVNVARLYPEKAQQALLELFARIHRRAPRTVLWILGTGPLEGELREKCAELRLGESVRFFGFVEDLPAVLELADAQVHPSHAEGIPLAICSGMAAGLPIVASDVGGMSEVIEHDRRGLLVPPAGEPGFPEAFVAATFSLVQDPERRARLGAAARRFIEQDYSLETAVSVLGRTYRDLLRARRRKRRR